MIELHRSTLSNEIQSNFCKRSMRIRDFKLRIIVSSAKYRKQSIQIWLGMEESPVFLKVRFPDSVRFLGWKNRICPDPSFNDFYKLSAEKRIFKIGRYLTELEANTIFPKMPIYFSKSSWSCLRQLCTSNQKRKVLQSE